MPFTRREMLSSTLLAAAATASEPTGQPTLCVFSKHLAKLNYQDLARAAKEMGFAGVDLTARPGGHVLPERVAADLPRAVEAIRAAGLSVPMITTNLLNAQEAVARPTLETAAKLKVPFYKPGYWRYRGSLESSLATAREGVTSLTALAKEFGVTGGCHNHSGDYVGAAVWDTRSLIGDLDPRFVGYYFDPCHATIEGGLSNWKVSTELVLPRLKMIAIKDFFWEKADGKWRVHWCPLGQGMVDWPKFWSMLAAARWSGPVSLHVEYETPDEAAALGKDLQALRPMVAAAYGRAG